MSEELKKSEAEAAEVAEAVDDKKEYPPTFVDKFFLMHARACERHADKGGIYNLVRWLVKQQELIVYLVVGVLNTIVSLGAFWIFAKFVLDANDLWQNVALNTISWVVGVVFGYVMNRIYVFRSHDPHIMLEFVKFAGGRVITWGTDTGMMLLMINLWHWNVVPFGSEAIPSFLRGETIPKIISAVVVVILNYVFSKLFVFKSKKH